MISMNKTYTPQLTPEVLQRLRATAILRPIGQAGHLPGGRHGLLRQTPARVPGGPAALLAPVVDLVPQATRRSEGPRRVPPGQDQGPNRLGIARPGPPRGP